MSSEHELCREVRKEECPKCSGRGTTIRSCSSKCTNCDGKGWVLDKAGEPYICCGCDGHGVVSTKTSIKCSNCHGQGWIVEIVALVCCEVECDICGGGGRLAEEKCPDCGYTRYPGYSIEVDEDGEYVKVMCLTCLGSATWSAACHECDGNGTTTYEVERIVTPKK